jgi:hypothetical protein
MCMFLSNEVFMKKYCILICSLLLNHSVYPMFSRGVQQPINPIAQKLLINHLKREMSDLPKPLIIVNKKQRALVTEEEKVEEILKSAKALEAALMKAVAEREKRALVTEEGKGEEVLKQAKVLEAALMKAVSERRALVAKEEKAKAIFKRFTT